MAQSDLQSFMNECRELQSGRRKWFIPKMKVTHLDKRNGTRRFEIGERNIAVKEKVVLLLGASGSGKSSLVNTIFNCLLGIQWNDDFRFNLVEEGKRSQTQSQTDYITMYTIHQKPWFRVPFTLTLIDTPGFGDTRGLQRDKELISNIKLLFASKDSGGVEVLDGVGFVVPAVFSRLTPVQRYIFDSVMSLFGKDIVENIFVFATFFDGQKPIVIESLNSAGLPYTSIFKFNNIFRHSDDCDEDEETFQKLFWKIGQNSFEKLIFHLDKAVPKSLSLSKDVLNERRKLEAITESVHKEIKFMLYTLLQLNVEKQIIQRFKSEYGTNKTITYEVLEMSMTKKATLPGQYTTNCNSCNMTCHETCPFAENKEKCVVMKDGYCEICPQKCHYTSHRNQPHVYVMEAKKVTRTYEDLTHKYGHIGDKTLSSKHLIKCHNEVQAAQARILLLVEKAGDCVARLNEIALKPSSWSRSAYLEMLIVTEKSEGNPGLENRIQILEEIRDQAEHMLDPISSTPMTVYKHKPIESEPMGLEAAVVPICDKSQKAVSRAVPSCRTG